MVADMAQSDKENDPSRASPASRESTLSLDTQKIADAVVELNISRKNVQIYPLGHNQVERSMERAYQALLKALEANRQLTLGIAKDALMIGEKALDPDNAVFKEFASVLKGHNVAAVSFASGTGKDELLRFLVLISKRPGEIADSGGFKTCLSEASLSHIALKMMDYSQFHLTEEQKVVKTEPDAIAHDADFIWRDFISRFISGTLSKSGQAVSEEDITAISPVQLAHALNSGQVGNEVALKVFDSIVARHLRYAASENESAEKSSGSYGSLNLLLQELNPKLRRQFLSVTFNNCEERSHLPETEALVRGLSQDFVIDMLREASEEGKEISPSLLSLVQKIYNIEGIETVLPQMDSAWSSAQGPAHEELKHLFKREDHESFIVPEYDALLKQMATGALADQNVAESGFSLEAHLEEMESPQIDFKIARVLAAFLDMELDIDEYRDFADRLLASVPPLLSAGAFEILLAIAETFDRHGREKANPEVRSAAEAALMKLKTSELAKKAVRVFNRVATLADSSAVKFLVVMGSGVVPDAVATLAHREAVSDADPLYEVLGHFREETIIEIKKRLKDNRLQVVINMLSIVKALKAGETADVLMPFLDHSDSIVRMQVLRAFLEFEDPTAIPHLMRAIQSNRQEIVSQAIAWSEQYKVQEVVPNLMARIKRVAVFKSDLITNEQIIVALGRIGDPLAVSFLEKLATGRFFTLFRKRVVRMKRALFESLGGYPYDAILHLIEIGNRARDKQIRNICQKIIKKQAGSF